MSFCNEVKSELALIKGHKCCLRAEGMGLALGLKPSADGLVFRTSQADVAHLSGTLVDKMLGAEAVERVSASGRWYTRLYPGLDPAAAGFPDGRVDAERLDKPCCQTAFLRGVFLACGQMIDPRKNYRLDLLLPDRATGEAVCDVLRELDFAPRLSQRADGSVCVYFRDSTAIEDLLTTMGATGASLALMEIKVEKNYTNALNRRGNFDTANYVKTFEKAASQAQAIQWLADHGVLDDQPEPVREVAQLRLTHTDASLKELAALAHMGRSTVDRRLRELVALSESMQKRG